MPLVYQRQSTTRPEDAALLRMRNEVAARHRSRRLAINSKAAREIEYKQNAAYERTTKKPFLSEPEPKVGYSSPLWDGARGCWLTYSTADTSKWVAWDVLNEKWVDLAEYDKTISNPSGGSESKSEDSSPSTVSPQERSETTSSEKPKRSLKSIVQTVIGILAFQPRSTETRGDG